MINKYTCATLISIGFAFTHSAFATNGDIRVGLNAVEAGMGNAIIAKPEDAGTLFNNPAGLSGLEMKGMQLDMGFALMNPPRSVNGNTSDSNLFFMPSQWHSEKPQKLRSVLVLQRWLVLVWIFLMHWVYQVIRHLQQPRNY